MSKEQANQKLNSTPYDFQITVMFVTAKIRLVSMLWINNHAISCLYETEPKHAEKAIHYLAKIADRKTVCANWAWQGV